MAYARPATTYSGSTESERYCNSTQANRYNFELFLDDLEKWILRRGSWENIVTAPLPQQGGNSLTAWKSIRKVLLAPWVLLWDYLSLNSFSHLPSFLLLSFLAGYNFPIAPPSPEPFSLWVGAKILILWIFLAIVTWFLSFGFDQVHPHLGAPQSCVGCSAMGHVFGWFWFVIVGGGYLSFSVLDIFGYVSSGIPAIQWLSVLYLFALMNLTLSNLPVYGHYYHIWGDPRKALPGLGLNLLLIVLVYWFLPYVL